MKKTAKLFVMLSFLCVMAFALPQEVIATETVYDLEFSEAVLTVPVSLSDDLMVKNLVNDKIDIAFDVTNSGTERYGYIMCAYYSPEGQFLGQEWTFNLAKGEETRAVIPFRIDNTDGQIGYIKIFGFDSFDNMTPIAESFELRPAAGEHPVLWMGRQETVNDTVRLYVMGDEYYGWYVLDESVDPDLLKEYGIKNITVENSRIISMSEEAGVGDFVLVSDEDENGFADENDISYTFDPKGYGFFVVENDVVTEGYTSYPGVEYLRYGDRVIMAQKDGYVTDVYVIETIIRSFGGYVEVLSSEAVVDETTQSAKVTVRHLDTGEIKTYDLAAMPDPKNDGGYSRITFKDKEKVLVKLTSGEIFSEGTLMGYYMDHEKIVLTPPVEVDSYERETTAKNCMVVFTGGHEWTYGEEVGDINYQTRIYLIRETGEVEVYTGYEEIGEVQIEATRVYAISTLDLFHDIYIFCGEIIHDPNVLYYPGISTDTTLGTIITYYLNGEEKQSLVADGLELPEAGAYTFTIEGDVITSMTAIGIRGELEAKLLNHYIKVNGKKYNFGDKYVIYDVSNGISEAEEIPFERELIVITGFEERVCEIFIVGKAEPVVPSPDPTPEPEPEPITDMIIYYTGNHEEGAEGTEIEYYADGTSKTALLAEGLEVPAETGAYKAVFDSEEKITSLEKTGEYGKVTVVKASYFKTTDSTYVLADKVDVYNVTDGIDTDEIAKEDEVIVIINDDGETNLIFIVG